MLCLRLLTSSRISNESIVDVVADVLKSPEPIEKASQKTVELAVKKIHVVSTAAVHSFCCCVLTALQPLPLQLEDLARPSSILKEMKAKAEDLAKQVFDVVVYILTSS